MPLIWVDREPVPKGSVTIMLTAQDAPIRQGYGNAEGDWTGVMAGLAGTRGNLWEDPGFTAPGRGDFTLPAGSPCRRDRPGCGPLVRP